MTRARKQLVANTLPSHFMDVLNKFFMDVLNKLLE